MDKNLHDIEDLFRRGLDDNEEMPPENTWDRIDKILDKDKVLSIHKKYGRLKWAAILLLFFSAGMSIYVWNTRKSNNPEENYKAILNKEIKSKNNAARIFSDNINDVKKAVDSINTIDGGNNQNTAKEFGPTKIDKTILKTELEEKRSKSLITKRISDLAVSTEGRKSEKKINPGITKNLRNSSVTIQENEKENKPNQKSNRNTPPQHEDELDLAVRPVDIDSDKIVLPLAHLHSLPLSEVMSSTNDLIDTKKVPNAKSLFLPHATLNKSKSISKNKFKQSNKSSPFSITGFYSRDVSFFHLQENTSGDPDANRIADENGETETSANSFGVLIDFKPGRHWSLQSGVTLSTTHIDINLEDEPLYAKADNAGNVKYRVNTVLGYGYVLPSFSNNPNVGDSISSLSTNNTLQYLGIPLAVKYSFDKGKFSINAMAGISGNFLTQGKIETEVELGNDNEFETVDKIYGLKKFYVSGISGIGLDYHFYKNLSVSFSPMLRFALNPINKNTPVISYPNSLEFSLGMKAKL